MPMADPQTTSPPTLERADLRAAQAQEAIEKLEATFIAMTQGVIVYGPDGNIVRMNSAARAALRPDERFMSTTSPDARVALVKLQTRDGAPFPVRETPAWRALQGENSRNVDMKFTRPTGEVVWLSASGAPTRAKDGTLTGAVVTFSDVTEQRRAEEALLSVSTELRRTLDTAATGLIHCSRDLRYLSANAAYARWIGLPVEQIVGRLIVDVIGEAAFEVILPRVERVLAGERVEYEDELPIDGCLKPIQVVYTPDVDASGSVVGWVASVVDITERKRAEAKERKTERFISIRLALLEFAASHSLEEVLRETLDQIERLTQSPIGFYHFVDPDQKTLSLQAWSTRTVQEFCRAEGRGLHYSVDQAGVWVDCVRERRPVIHNDYASLPHRKGLPEGHAPLVRELVVPVLREGLVVAILGVGNKAVPYTDEDVESVSYLADVTWEIAARKSAEEALRDAARRKDEFLAMLSHELRNPLAPIRNSTYILRHAAPGSDQARRAQGVIERQTQHLTRLVDDLLDVTRIARGKIELRRERVDLREVVLRAADDFRLLLDDRGVTFRAALPDAKVWADIDVTRITQVVGNLMHNAAKFTRRGDEVTLSLKVVGAEAEFRVRDTGVGIDAALLPTIFDAFVQGERTMARTQGGLGLGLALVKGITELHGGTVSVESAGDGKGAEFIVLLPVEGPTLAPRQALLGLKRRDVCRRVLVVDDNADAADSLADVILMLGHAVEVEHDGPSAIAKAHASPPDVVLCDIGLPGMSGYEVAKALRAAGQNGMQLFALSGYAQPEDVQRAIEAGFDGHVAKPCDPEQIERLLA
jgi:PAS domain S-box-containing protein